MLFDLDSSDHNLDSIVTKDEILSRYREEDIYAAYYPDFQIGTCKSPFREDDNPSFSFFDKFDKIQWKDHTTFVSGDVFKFVEEYYKTHGRFLSFSEILKDINTVMKERIRVTPALRKEQLALTPKDPKSKKTLLQIVQSPGPKPSFFYPYWENQSICRNILNEYHVGLADEIWIKKYIKGEYREFIWAESTPENPIYYFLFPKTGHFKAYRPLEPDKKRRWISNIDKNLDVQGLEQLHLDIRRPRVIVITKSMKDVMLLRAFGVDAIAPHGEGHYFSAEFIAWLRTKCDLLISLYDNDFAGMRGAITLRKMYDIPDFYIPPYYGYKDSSDFNIGYYQAFYSMFELLLRHLKINYGIDGYTAVGANAPSRNLIQYASNHRTRR